MADIGGNFGVRVMGRAELDLVLSWAAAEGWNPGLYDATPFHVADPRGYLVGVLDGQPVAAISVVRYSPDYGFLGLYIVRPDFRGQGYGMAIWQAGMDYLSGGTVGLDGVLAQQPNYRKSGFVLACRNVRFAGELPTVEAPAGPVDLRAVPFDRLADYDRTRFPTPRPAFLSAWIAMPETVGLAALSDGRLGGYGVARRCRQGWKIGPLFADDETTAETLFTGLTARLGEGPVILDVPETNPAAVRLAERHGLAPVFETARMYAGPAPDIDPAGVFGITSFELG